MTAVLIFKMCACSPPGANSLWSPAFPSVAHALQHSTPRRTGGHPAPASVWSRKVLMGAALLWVGSQRASRAGGRGGARWGACPRGRSSGQGRQPRRAGTGVTEDRAGSHGGQGRQPRRAGPGVAATPAPPCLWSLLRAPDERRGRGGGAIRESGRVCGTRGHASPTRRASGHHRSPAAFSGLPHPTPLGGRMPRTDAPRPGHSALPATPSGPGRGRQTPTFSVPAPREGPQPRPSGPASLTQKSAARVSQTWAEGGERVVGAPSC